MKRISHFPSITIFHPSVTSDVIEIFFSTDFFFYLLRMSAATRSPAKEHLYKLEEYSSQASMRDGAYSRMSAESGSTVSALRAAASRAGLTSPSHSLKFAFSLEEEKALVVVCLLYARQGARLSIIDFIKLANHFAKKEEGTSFSRHFVD